MNLFTEWDLRPELQAVLADLSFTDPTPVQREAYPLVMEGHDLLVQSRTGTGKTLAFGLPLVQRLEAGRGNVAVLVVLPTRELALQVSHDLARLGRPLGISVAAVFGGGFYREQFQALQRGAQIVCGTPGRLCDLLDRGALNLSGCKTLVLDEADEILDMGFAEELDKVLAKLPKERQSLLFSATLSTEARELARKTLRNPRSVAVSTGLTAAPEIRHVCYEVYQDNKVEALLNVMHVERPDLALVFCHTKAETQELTQRLAAEGIQAAYLNGDLAQAARTQTLNSFRRRQVRLLVATDVAARGIDVKGITHVFNMGVCRDAEIYVHRTGRTGRAGNKGTAVTFVAPRDAGRFRSNLERAGIKVEILPVPGADDVRRRLRSLVHEDLVQRVTQPDAEPYLNLAQELLSYLEPAELVAALLRNDPIAKASLEAGFDVPVTRTKQVGPRAARSDYKQSRVERDAPIRRKDRERTPRGQEVGMVRVIINQGKAQRMVPGKVVRLVCEAAGIEGNAIGHILINPYQTFFDVRQSDASRVVEKLNGLMSDGKLLKASLAA